MPVNHLKNIKLISKLLDRQFSLFGIKIGLDPVLGLIPGIGDFVALALGAYIIYSANQLGVPGYLLSKMWANLFFDLILGAIPGIGDVADVFFRANLRNTRILEKYLSDNRIEEAEIVG